MDDFPAPVRPTIPTWQYKNWQTKSNNWTVIEILMIAKATYLHHLMVFIWNKWRNGEYCEYDNISEQFQHMWKYMHQKDKWMNGVLGHDSALLKLYWAGDKLGKCDECCYESCPWHRIAWPVGQQPSVLPLYHECLLHQKDTTMFQDILTDNNEESTLHWYTDHYVTCHKQSEYFLKLPHWPYKGCSLNSSPGLAE